MPQRDNPEWREMVEDTLRRQHAGKQDRRSIGLNLSAELQGHILSAAQLRGGISLASYLRRSAIAVACYDLGLDWGEVTAGEQTVRVLGKPGIASNMRPGEGFGPWLIDGMRMWTP